MTIVWILGYNPFDLNRDGKVDWQDAYLYDEFFGDDDNSSKKNVRWTSKDTETASGCLGTILGGIIIFWILSRFL